MDDWDALRSSIVQGAVGACDHGRGVDHTTAT